MPFPQQTPTHPPHPRPKVLAPEPTYQHSLSQRSMRFFLWDSNVHELWLVLHVSVPGGLEAPSLLCHCGPSQKLACAWRGWVALC